MSLIGNMFILMELERQKRKESWGRANARGRWLRKFDLDELSDTEFIKMFRVNKEIAQEIFSTIIPHMKAKRDGSISPERKILATLHVLGTGSYQYNAGTNYAIAMSQVSVSRAMKEVIPLILQEFGKEVQFPTTSEERTRIAKGFKRLGVFDGVLGAIDCTHCRIKRPAKREEDFVGHKGYHSLNVLMTCDAALRITYVTSYYPGKVNDQFIFHQSDLYNEMKGLSDSGIGTFYLLGDSGFCLEKFLLTPVLDAATGSAEQNYTWQHCSVRNTIERVYGILKARFRILHKSRQITYNPLYASQIIDVCSILHNMMMRYNMDLPSEEEIRKSHRIRPNRRNRDKKASKKKRRDEALAKRREIINRYFPS